jgi:hypothetical protein
MMTERLLATYKQNDNLNGDGSRCFGYGDENQSTKIWHSDFLSDGKMRRRERVSPGKPPIMT